MANFEFNTDRSNFHPFTLQEMLIPFAAYKDAYDKAEAKYDELSEKSNAFSYLSENLPEGSKARQIYEGYANALKEQAEDFQRNGFYRGNSMGLTSLKRRYSGEIGRLVKADEALKEINKQNRVLDAQDSTRLYAKDNLTIDDVLDGENYNPYVVSGKELYARGAAAASAASKRIFSIDGEQNTLGGFYKDFVQRNGYSPKTMQAFREKMESIPELAQAVSNIDREFGVSDNLQGTKRSRALQSIVNGILDGAIYTESHTPTRNPGVMSALEKENLELAKKQFEWEKTKDILKSTLEAKAANGKVPLYKGITYVQGNGGAANKAEAIDPDATKVNIVSNGKGMNNGTNYEVKLGTGKDAVILGTVEVGIDGQPYDFVPNNSYKKEDLKKLLNHGTSWTRFGNDWDDEYDPKNVAQMGETIRDIIKREGTEGLQGYNFYLFPDNANKDNHDGGFFIEALERGNALSPNISPSQANPDLFNSKK